MSEEQFISVPCPEFLGRPIRIRIQGRNLEYAEDSEEYQVPRSASIEEEALFQAVKDSLTPPSKAAPESQPHTVHPWDALRKEIEARRDDAKARGEATSLCCQSTFRDGQEDAFNQVIALLALGAKS